MPASCFAIPYVMKPLLDMRGLGGANFVNIRKAIKLRGESTSCVHFPVGCATDSSFLFDVLECGDEFVPESGSGVLADGVVGDGVCK